jgi:hypothetical protein
VSGRDGTSSERLSGNQFFLTCKQCRNSGTLLNSGIPVKKHRYIQVILSNQNEANYTLTNSLELREYNLRVIVLINLLSSRCRSAVAVLELKSILGRSPKVKDSIKDPFK